MAEAFPVSQFIELQKIVCCPRTKSALSLITVSDLIKRLPEEEHHRVPAGTTAAFLSKPSLTAYPIVGRIVDFLEQDSLQLSKDGCGSYISPDEQSGAILQM
jgi:uncharacterized protein YbaR (Trm112 family)